MPTNIFLLNSVLKPPFATRVYPSPRTGKAITVNVKEMPLLDFPEDFVDENFGLVWDRGHHLIATDIRGCRPWTARDIEECAKQFGNIPREQPWTEVWEILSQDQVAALDLIMFTGFYSDQSMDRFEKFAELALPLIKHHNAIIKKASYGGVCLAVNEMGSEDWKEIAESVMAFNEKFFTREISRPSALLSWKRSKTLWFGYC